MPTFPCHHKACPSRPCRWRCEILSEMAFCHVNCVQNCVFRLPSLPPTSATPEKVSETSIFEAPIVFPFEKQQKLAVRSLFRLPRPSAGFLGLARTKSACVVEKERASWEKSVPRAKSDTCRPLLGSAQPRLSPRPQVPLQVWPTTTLTLLATPLMSFSAHFPLVALGLGWAPQGWAGWRCRMKKRFAATRNAAVRGWGQHATCGKEKFCYRTALEKRTVALGRGVPRLHAHVIGTPFPAQNVPPKLSQTGHLVLSPNAKSWVGMHASPTQTWQPPHVLTWMCGDSAKLQPHVVCTSFPKVLGPPKWYQTGHVNYLVVGTSHMPRLDIKGYKHVHTIPT